ncbi:glycosyltransferase family 2 protein [Marinobacter sp. SBS5]|uniref:glycosyltransferase family 2 protein n=1 Tax=Marinobacter sp. SBS5 TaxID=3401754 RepID=UPI003AAE4998
MDPEVSIIIPVFQDQAGLERCLMAISRQSGVLVDGLEVIVVDNGSEPPLTLPKELPYTANLLACAKKGAYAARNAGVGAANAKVLAFLDADCWPDKYWIQAGLKALSKSGRNSIFGGEVLFEQSPRPTVVESYQLLMGFGQNHAIKKLGFSATANIFVTREVFEKVGPFDENLLSGGDREWSWRARSLGVSLDFSEDAIVWTEPRKTLRGALIQARRVSGGRMGLEKNAEIVQAIGVDKIQPKKGVLEKSKVILFAQGMPLIRRFMIFGVAILIRAVHDLERIRIRLGGEFERR